MTSASLADDRDDRAAGTIVEPREAARAAGLRYVNDTRPGITRHPDGEGFAYRDARRRSRCATRRRSTRIRALAIPPAWTDVWICPQANGHLQATGRDARGRKQYRYHPRWREVRDATKYERMAGLRARAARASARASRPTWPAPRPAAREGAGHRGAAAGDDADPRRQRRVRAGERVLRADDAARPARHGGGRRRCASRFRGKSGKTWRARPARPPPRAASCGRARTCRARSCSSTSTRTATLHDVTSADVNDYLREISRRATFTAKDFRTWAGTVLAALALREFEAFDSAGGGQDERPRGRSSASSPGWATRRPSAASATSTRPCSTPTWRASSCSRWPSAAEAELRDDLDGAAARGGGGAGVPGGAEEGEAVRREAREVLRRRTAPPSRERRAIPPSRQRRAIPPSCRRRGSPPPISPSRRG